MYKDGRILLTENWLFALTDEVGVEALSFDDSAFRPVILPHDWQIETPRDENMARGGMQGYYPREGVGWYRLRFDAPAEWKGKIVRVLFDGVQRFSSVYLNGRLLGEKKYGYVPFFFELDGLNYDEENLLAVRVDNSTCGGDRWYSGAGIYREVYLLVDEPVHIPPWGLHAKAEVDGGDGKLSFAVKLENRGAAAQHCTLSIRATDPDGTGVFEQIWAVEIPAGGRDWSGEARIPNIALWDIANPALYNVEAALSRDDHLFDTASVDIGFRTAYFDADEGFFLNGRNMKLWGVNLHHDGGALGAAVPLRVWKRRLEKLKAIGVNAVRTSHNPQAEAFYDLCDAMGLLVIDELYDKWSGSELYFGRLTDEDRLEDLNAMVARDFHHPSIILWSMGNEVEIQYSEEFYRVLKLLCDACRALDGTRPVSTALIGFVLPDYNDNTPLDVKVNAVLRYAEIVDVFMGNYMENFYQAFRAAGMRRAVIGSEVFTYYRLADLTATTSLAQSPWSDVRDNPWVAGGFLWAGVDYLGESIGWPCRGWTGCALDSAGFEKPRTDYLKSQWTDEAMIAIAVYDETEPWDMANTNWSFPQMTAHWNHKTPCKMMHVAVMTNCDEVRLYLNDENVRVGRPDAPDRIAHFYVPFFPGQLRAVGLRAGEAVCETVLRTSTKPTALALSVYEEDLRADGRDVCHIEARLLDEWGQPWTQSNPKITFSVEGPCEILAVDTGDFQTTTETYHDRTRSMHYGHALLILRAGQTPGAIRVTAEVDIADVEAQSVEIVSE